MDIRCMLGLHNNYKVDVHHRDYKVEDYVCLRCGKIDLVGTRKLRKWEADVSIRQEARRLIKEAVTQWPDGVVSKDPANKGQLSVPVLTGGEMSECGSGEAT